MNPTEAAELLAHCSAFDNRKPSAAAAVAWASALNDVPLDADAKDAVAAYYSTPPQDPEAKLWIQPHNVRTLRTKIRNGRLENFQYEPVEGETVQEYLARLRGQVRAVAAGEAASLGRPMLEGGPAREFLTQLADRGWSVGRDVPDAEDATVTAIDSVRRSGPLGVVCPTCQAAIGRPCKTPSPGGSDKQPLGKPRKHPHSARRRAAEGTPEVTPQQRAVEEQRRREASAQALARMEADGEIVDAEIVDDGEAS